jgi:hypothetical protein
VAQAIDSAAKENFYSQQFRIRIGGKLLKIKSVSFSNSNCKWHSEICFWRRPAAKSRSLLKENRA